MTAATNPPIIPKAKTHYNLLITSAEKDAAAFFAASNWRGKLSPANQRRYNNLLAEKSKREAEMNQAIKEAAERNRTAIQEAKTSDQLALLEKQETDTKNGDVLAIVAVLSCLLFTVCMGLKEFYEYRTAMELTHAGAMKNPRFAQMLKEAEKTISDDELRRQFAQQASLNGHQNRANTTPPHQSQQPFVQTNGRTTYFNRRPDGNVQAVLTQQPLFPPPENTVSQSSQTVTQKNAATPANYADDTLKLAEKEIRGHYANFGRKSGKDSTVSDNINQILDETMDKMRSEHFSPSYERSVRFYRYVNELFEALETKGWPYHNKLAFLAKAHSRIPQPA